VKNKEAIAFFNKAESFAISGRALHENKVDAIFAESVVRFLYAHAIELHLKAFLLSKGVALETLKSSKVGHKYKVLCKLAREHGLLISDETQNGIEQIEEFNNAMDSRYVSLGWVKELPLDFLDAACLELREASMSFILT